MIDADNLTPNANTTPAVLERNSMIAALQFAAEDAFAELRDLHAMIDLKADQLSQVARDLSKMRQQIEMTLNRLEGKPCFYYNGSTGKIAK